MSNLNVKNKEKIVVNENESGCNSLTFYLYNPLLNDEDHTEQNISRRVLSCLSGCAIKTPGKC